MLKIQPELKSPKKGVTTPGKSKRLNAPRRSLSPQTLKSIIDRIVRVSQPERIILFGSGARDQLGLNSDVDLLVVKAGRFDRGLVAEQIYLGLEGIGQAVDVTVVTPKDVETYRNSPYLVIAAAVNEGRVVYAA